MIIWVELILKGKLFGNIMSVNGNGSVIVDVNDGSILYENSNLKVFDVTKFGENYFLAGGNGGQSYI